MFALPLMLSSVGPASASTIRAVLVGVGTYADPELRPLDGARNDAVLIGETLMRRFGVARSDMTLLVDHAERARPASSFTADDRPTRHAILAALERAASATMPGDQLVILLSGHGVQQREAIAGDEPDGLDEAFLPADAIAPPDTASASARYRNAIIDSEIGRAVDTVLDRGGDVFLLADFCHSGDALRGGSEAAVGMVGPDRRIDLATRGATTKRGRLTAFFTARADREGAQRAAPFWDLAHAEPHGVLSFYAAAALADPSISRYDELFDRINAYIRASNDALIADAAPAELPAPEGRLDLPILGRPAPASSRRGWTIEKPASTATTMTLERLLLPAGSLAGVVPGTIFAISAPGYSDNRPLLYGRSESVGNWSSVLLPASYAGVGVEAWADLRVHDPSDPGPQPHPFTRSAALFAREVERPLDLALTVRAPGAARSPAQRQALAALSGIRDSLPGVRFVRTGRADLVLRFAADAIEVAAAERPGARAYGRLPIAGRASDMLGVELIATLERAARFHRIAGILQAMSLSAEEDNATIGAIDVRFYLQQAMKPPNSKGECSAADFGAGEPIPLNAIPLAAPGLRGGPTPRYAQCDALYLSFTNHGTHALHLFPVVLAPEGAIYVLPTQDYGSQLFEPGRTGTARYLLSTDPGRELARDDLILIAVEVDPGDQAPPIPAALEQPAIVCQPAGMLACMPPMQRAGTGAAGPVQRALLELLAGTRALPQRLDHVGFRRFSWYTAPAPSGPR